MFRGNMSWLSEGVCTGVVPPCREPAAAAQQSYVDHFFFFVKHVDRARGVLSVWSWIFFSFFDIFVSSSTRSPPPDRRHAPSLPFPRLAFVRFSGFGKKEASSVVAACFVYLVLCKFDVWRETHPRHVIHDI